MAAPTEPAPGRKLSGNQVLGLGLTACALLIVVVVVVSTRFTRPVQAPPPPPPPPPPEQSVGRIMRYSASYYKAVTEEDVKRYALPAVDANALAQPLVYSNELAQPRLLKLRHDVVETDHLQITPRVIKEWAATDSGQRFRYEHITLAIKNKSARPLAYRVDTTINHPESCQSQGAIAHNAIALAPGETVERTECLWHRDTSLTLRAVEVMELPPIGYIYVSRLRPTQILLDGRTAAGHTVPPPAKECSFVPWRDIEASTKEQHTTWADIIDFYARHNCDEYSFYRGYRRWTSAGTLPARADSGPAVIPVPVDHLPATK